MLALASPHAHCTPHGGAWHVRDANEAGLAAADGPRVVFVSITIAALLAIGPRCAKVERVGRGRGHALRP